MEPYPHGRHRVEQLTRQALKDAGLPADVAARLAGRAQTMGMHPPLDEDEAGDIAPHAWLHTARTYAATVGLQEEVRTSCTACDAEGGDAESGCAACDGEDLVIQHAWLPVGTAGRMRHPAWVVLLHGMNTRGPWQEELSWQLSLLGTTANPVRIWKYGRLVISVLSRRRLRRLAKRVASDLLRLAEEAATVGRHGPGDVVAHSLGTWLIGHALRLHPELKLGRIILTGAILPPTFEWDELLDEGRVDAVFNHRGGRDLPVRFAQFVIPDSGPSGHVGFTSPNVIDVIHSTWGHSAFFAHGADAASSHLTVSLDAFWKPFLVWDDRTLHMLGEDPGHLQWVPSRLGRGRPMG